MTKELKIYFAGSICGGRDDGPLYASIIGHLKSKYGVVLTEKVGYPDIMSRELKTQAENGQKNVHDRALSWLEEADVVVAEVTQPSMGVGYEMATARGLGKPVLCLFRPEAGKHLSSMIKGAENGKSFFVKDYAEAEVENVIDSFMRDVMKVD